MSKYKGFISWDTYKELQALLDSIAEFKGIENSMAHLWSPDTNMNDNICENFEFIKNSLILKLMEKINDILRLATEITNLEQD